MSLEALKHFWGIKSFHRVLAKSVIMIINDIVIITIIFITATTTTIFLIVTIALLSVFQLLLMGYQHHS